MDPDPHSDAEGSISGDKLNKYGSMRVGIRNTGAKEARPQLRYTITARYTFLLIFYKNVRILSSTEPPVRERKGNT
jgi:hypothetical protein